MISSLKSEQTLLICAGSLQALQECDVNILLSRCHTKGLDFLALVYSLYLPSKPLQLFLQTLQV